MQCAVTDSRGACRNLFAVAVCTALVLCAVATLSVKLVVRGSPDRRQTASPVPAKSSDCEPRRGATDVLSVSRGDFGLQLVFAGSVITDGLAFAFKVAIPLCSRRIPSGIIR